MSKLCAFIKLMLVATAWLLSLASQSAHANPQHLNGTWHLVYAYSTNAPDKTFLKNPLASNAPIVKSVGLTGGHYLYIAPISITKNGSYVLDFKNTSTIEQFRHQVFDDQNRLVASLEGGIESKVENPFFLRHGRELTLAPGNYTLATEVDSTNFLAEPEPYLNDREHYQTAIKWGNVVTLFGLGIFFGLGIYYAALATSRNRWAEAMYASFIVGNFIYNSAALLVFSDVLGLRSIYFVSMPVLLSNIAYMLFVMHLLEITKYKHKYFYWAGVTVIGIMSLFLGLAVAYPNWALELCRYGVALFLSYGLVAAITESLQKNATAKRYLFAISIFFVSGLIAISLTKIDGQFTFYIEHIGLVSVAIEVILLALVLSFQFSQLHDDKEKAMQDLEISEKTAHSDALTGLPNRHALVKEVHQLPVHGSLTFVDLDGLKFYNDAYGHEKGDELLCAFAQCYQKSLGADIKLYRMGGDEFAALSHKGDMSKTEAALNEALQAMRANGFEFAGASAGSAYHYEAENVAILMRMADARMYESKRLRKLTQIDNQQTLKFNQ
jgi:diguanylate cyclase